ncbi:MAG: T9SS type A sorting domain-containing protein [Candidatus Sabulitectum sp.]|nr:T9SS type A sorting domain-containing protein [Candidatus Sabulitectum sp.]
MRIMVVILVMFTCIAFADTGIQSDWSGGPGVEGPVTDWGDSFLSSVLINWFDEAGSIFLDQMASYNHIRQVGDLAWAKPCHMDNDEYPDVFVTDGDDGTKWYHNASSGSGWGERDFADTNGIVDITTGDVDGDGDYDVFASVHSYLNDGFFWYKRLNDYGTQWELQEIDSEDHPSRVFSLDFNGDGDIDLLGSYNGKHLSWWENQSSGQNWIKHIISENAMEHGITSIDVADCDNDGDYDVVCGTLNSDEIYLFINHGNDTWEFQGIEYVSEGSMREVSFADIDGDNLQDLVTDISGDPSEILWFRNTGSTENWEPYLIDSVYTGVYPASVGDVDADDDIDVIIAISSSGTQSDFAWWENIDPLNNQWIYHPPVVSEDIYRSNYFAEDVNQDGKCDVVSYYRYSSNPSANKVAWWNLNSGYSTGTAQLESSILYVYDVDWGSIDWSAITPDGTSVSFEVRSSDDPEDMGDWSGIISSPGSLAPYLAGNDSYLQYRATLATTDSTVTPVLEDVVLTWATTGIEGSENFDEISLSILQNPSAGSVRFGVNLPSQFNVTLAVYDAAGRIVGNVVNGEYPAGSTAVQLDMLQPGTYFCRMQADGQSFTEQFTIIRD